MRGSRPMEPLFLGKYILMFPSAVYGWFCYSIFLCCISGQPDAGHTSATAKPAETPPASNRGTRAVPKAPTSQPPTVSSEMLPPSTPQKGTRFCLSWLMQTFSWYHTFATYGIWNVFFYCLIDSTISHRLLIQKTTGWPLCLITYSEFSFSWCSSWRCL